MGLFRPKRHTDRVGDVSEAAIAARLLQAGYVVLTPYGKQHRYDLVIEDAEARFWRIQCKTARVVQDGSAIAFNACSSHYSYIDSKSMGVHKKSRLPGAG
jgi:PD-(D/E)XK endonuclease